MVNSRDRQYFGGCVEISARTLRTRAHETHTGRANYRFELQPKFIDRVANALPTLVARPFRRISNAVATTQTIADHENTTVDGAVRRFDETFLYF
jgi:hypothetical protein